MATIDVSAEELRHHRRLLADDVRRRSASLRRPRRLPQSTRSETRGTQAKQQRPSAEETKRARPRAGTGQPYQQTQSAERTMQLRPMRERVEQARARQALRDVQDPSWWNRASASDLERVRAIANRAGSTERQAIHDQMQNVARTRYGTTVSGAIQYERSNPNQPPPDLAHARGPVR